MKCTFCDGVAHPSTGCQYTETMVQCYRCTVEVWAWFRRQQHKKWGGMSFYEHALKEKDESQA